ncbi:hypothetical protein H5410_002316 [Solanum commersonii]|uniref:Uncharacterized protein n=1 Tax=Solanum commersonii TaxID=4109 RepID=A0A9J6B2I9_SOLCO|nr:hypothetical protein H5410_002316 [Solanum commersonii]
MITPLKYLQKKGMITCLLIMQILLQCLKHKESISKGKYLQIKCPPKNGYPDHSIAMKNEKQTTLPASSTSNTVDENQRKSEQSGQHTRQKQASSTCDPADQQQLVENTGGKQRTTEEYELGGEQLKSVANNQQSGENFH